MNNISNNRGIYIIFSGDIAILDNNSSNENNFIELSHDVKKLLTNSDLHISNIEAPLTFSKTKIIKTGPHIKSNPQNTRILKDLNINIACLSNNHIRDYHDQGVKETIEILNKNDISTVGAGKDIYDAAKPLIRNIQGKKICIFNFSEDEFNTADKDKAGSNSDNPINIWYSISKIINKVDLIYVVMHGGKEMFKFPTPNQIRLYRFIIDLGVDGVFGHHTHVIGNYEIYKGKPILYSLGNLIFNEKNNSEEWYEGIIAQLNLNHSLDYDLIFYKTKYNKNTLEITDSVNVSDINKNSSNNKFIKRLDEKVANDEWQKLCKSSSLKASVNLLNYSLLERILLKIGLKRINSKEKRKLLMISDLLKCRTNREFTLEALKKYLIEK